MRGYRRQSVLRSYSGSCYVTVYIFTPFRSVRRHLKMGHSKEQKAVDQKMFAGLDLVFEHRHSARLLLARVLGKKVVFT